ncbi:ABC transporter ATP-binding protein [Chloroflexota bacterium]
MLEVDGIDVYYGDLQALWDVSLTVEGKELAVICGSNGSGKSTLLKTVVGILKPERGSIKFLGERIDGIPPYNNVAEGISLVPEGARVFPYTTVIDNLKLGAYTVKEKEQIKDSLKFVYEFFPVLRERENQLAGTLSGGERQMLAIGRALMSEPKLLLLDEPSAGLAPLLSANLFEVIKEINKGKGTSILLSEQNLHQALKLADKAYVLETGRVVLAGTGEEVLNNDMVKKAYLGL